MLTLFHVTGANTQFEALDGICGAWAIRSGARGGHEALGGIPLSPPRLSSPCSDDGMSVPFWAYGAMYVGYFTFIDIIESDGRLELGFAWPRV